jgi:DNA ligase D-like protein (predicted 3'-phosphoesterase)
MAGLSDYRRKRDPRRTPEPFGGGVSGATPLFVVQRHDARRLHYDLRLERNGALASWAVPKGLPLRAGERHLAVHVEDHPLDYASFEGVIPAGEYGAGTVEIWDRGTYELLEEKRDGGLTVHSAASASTASGRSCRRGSTGTRGTGSSCGRTHRRRRRGGRPARSPRP